MRVLFLVVFLLSAMPLGQAVGAEGDDAVTFTGTFNWTGEGNKIRAVKAVFTPTKKKRVWDVKFHFEFGNQQRTYTGTAKGKLSSGKLTGTVKNANKRRTFSFTGKWKKKKFSGTHSEVFKGGNKRATGTINIAAKKDED